MKINKKFAATVFCIFAGIFCVIFAAWLVITNTQTPEFNGAAVFNVKSSDCILRIYGSKRENCEAECVKLTADISADKSIKISDKLKAAASEFNATTDMSADSPLYVAAVADSMLNKIKQDGFSAASVDCHTVSAHYNIAKGEHLWEFDIKQRDDAFIKIGTLKLGKSECAAVSAVDTTAADEVSFAAVRASTAVDAKFAAEVCAGMKVDKATVFLQKAGLSAVLGTGNKKLIVSEDLNENFDKNILSEYK